MPPASPPLPVERGRGSCSQIAVLDSGEINPGYRPNVEETTAPRLLYPEIDPYEHGMLDVGDGQDIYWESCGQPTGKPVHQKQAGTMVWTAPSGTATESGPADNEF